MNTKDHKAISLSDFEEAVSQIGSFKPKEAIRKPEKAPSKKELAIKWKLERQ